MGVPRDYFFERLDPDVARLVEEAIGLLQPVNLRASLQAKTRKGHLRQASQSD